MSDRIARLNEIVATLDAGAKFYRDGAEKLSDSELTETFAAHAKLRDEAAGELKQIVEQAGGEPASASLRERAHEAYARIASVFGDTREKLIDSLEEHEDRTLATYRKAIADEALAEDKEMLQSQLSRFEASHDRMRALKRAA